MSSLFDINPLNKVYHSNNIEIIADGLTKQLDKFAEANPDSKLIEEKREQIIALREAQIFHLKVYKELEEKEKDRLKFKGELYRAIDTIEILKRNVETLEAKYTGLINFK